MARKPHAAAAVDTVHMGEAARARPLARTHVTARALSALSAPPHQRQHRHRCRRPLQHRCTMQWKRMPLP